MVGQVQGSATPAAHMTQNVYFAGTQYPAPEMEQAILMKMAAAIGSGNGRVRDGRCPAVLYRSPQRE
jgi:hypothetical protein